LRQRGRVTAYLTGVSTGSLLNCSMINRGPMVLQVYSLSEVAMNQGHHLGFNEFALYSE